MKKILFLLFVLIPVMGFSQAKRPAIMVVPSDVWCNENNCMTEFDNQGAIQKVPDYKKALLHKDMYLVINKIGEIMSEKGFPLKDLGMSVKSLETNAALTANINTGDNSKIVETPFEKLLKTAKADIILFVHWSVNAVGPSKSLTFIVQGADAYSTIQVAAASGTSPNSYTEDVPLLLTQSLITHIDPFVAQLQAHFNDIRDNGRTVKLTCLKSESSATNYLSQFNGEELSMIIENIVYENTVEGVFNLNIATENMMEFQMRIPLYAEDGVRAIDTRYWTMTYVQKVLRAKYNIDSKVDMKGLGEVFLTIL